MDNTLASPATLTPLALLGLVIVQIAQLFRGHMDAKAGREAKIDDSLAAILQRVMDQHAASMERQSVAMERVGATMTEVQAHMRDNNTVLASIVHRLEAVERRLEAGSVSHTPATRPPVGGRSRANREA